MQIAGVNTKRCDSVYIFRCRRLQGIGCTRMGGQIWLPIWTRGGRGDQKPSSRRVPPNVRMELICVYCDCDTGLIINCKCADDLIWCDILLFGRIFNILLS